VGKVREGNRDNQTALSERKIPAVATQVPPGRTVAIIGASRDRTKYGNLAVREHVARGDQVFPINPNAKTVEGLRAYARLRDVPIDRIKRIALYVPATIGVSLLQEIADKRPDEVWVNPGSESEALLAEATRLQLPVIQACGLVNLRATRPLTNAADGPED
jgi:predicted CoA-binding protein